MSPLPPASQHILVVDDYDYVYRVVTRMLRRAGYTVTATTSARDAMEVIRRDSPPVNLLLTDVRMPEISGPELAAAARRLDPDLPLVFMSGYTDFDDESVPFGAPFLNKPFAMQALLEAIESEIGRPIKL